MPRVKHELFRVLFHLAGRLVFSLLLAFPVKHLAFCFWGSLSLRPRSNAAKKNIYKRNVLLLTVPGFIAKVMLVRDPFVELCAVCASETRYNLSDVQSEFSAVSSCLEGALELLQCLSCPKLASLILRSCLGASRVPGDGN